MQKRGDIRLQETKDEHQRTKGVQRTRRGKTNNVYKKKRTTERTKTERADEGRQRRNAGACSNAFKTSMQRLKSKGESEQPCGRESNAFKTSKEDANGM